MFFWVPIIAWVLAGFLPSFAADPTSYTPKNLLTIPLPRQSEYAPQGLQSGLGVGAVWRNGCQPRFQWQAATEFSYSPTISGRAAVRLFGGSISNQYSLVYSRYFLESRYHYLMDSVTDFFVGPVLGFDNASFQSIRAAWDSTNSTPTASSADQYCQEAFDMNGPSLGWDFGFGHKVTKNIGINGSNTVEINFQQKIRFAFSFGVAYNALVLVKRFQQNLGGAWIHLDWVGSFTMPQTGLEHSLELGFSILF